MIEFLAAAANDESSKAVHDMLITVVAAMAGGAFLITLARTIKTSAIGLLILGAFLLGPEMLGILQPASLGDGLRVIVSIAIGIILFEGGLTLNFNDYQKASKVIKKLLIYGVLITWFGTAGLIYFLFEYPIQYCLLFGSLVIVTGPTVIAPLLRRIRLKPKLHTILHWEGVLIDPIGVFIALLCYEYVVGLNEGQSGVQALQTLFARVALGTFVGVVGGYLLVWILKRKLIPNEMTNVFSLGFAILTFGVADAFYAESGLLSVTVAGFITGLKKPVEFESIKTFKAELTDLMIGTLFMLLASRLKIEQFTNFGLSGYILVLFVMILIRPLSISICSFKSDLTIKEKLFLGWVAPRGIVAASFASIVAINLAGSDVVDPTFPETFVYSVIIGTIVFQEFTAGLYARLLGIQQPVPTGWLIIGAHLFARNFAKFLKSAGVESVILVDQNQRSVEAAEGEGLTAMTIDARDPKIVEDKPELTSVGHLVALTDNENLNLVVCDRWSIVIPEGKSWFWGTANMTEGKHAKIGKPLWGDLPKPTLLSQELETEETIIAISDQPVKTRDGRSSRLLVAHDHKDGLVMDPKADLLEDLEGKATFFYVRRRAESLLKAISPHLVTMANFEDQDSLFRKLVTMASKVNPAELPIDDLVKALHEREKTAPTAVGHGVAIPHVTSDLVDHRICAVAKVPDGVPYEVMDGETVRLVFLILSPSNEPEGHLAMLAEIARLCGNKKLRDELMAAEDAQELLEILQQRYG